MSLDNEGGAGRRRIHLREISGGEGEAPLDTVGQDLRAARLRRGDEIAEVSRNLKIRKDHLTALEEDRIEDLPGKTYAIGFVRSYARYLGLDASEYVERFKQEIAGRGDEPAPIAASVPQDEERRLPRGWRFIGIVVIALLGYGAWHIFAGDRDSGQTVPPPPVVMNAPKVAVAANPAPPPAATQTAVPSPAIDASGPVPAAKPAPRGSASSDNGQQAAVASPAIGQVGGQTGAAVPPLASGKVYGKQNVNSRVVLRLRTPTHIEIVGPDGNIYLNRAMEAGDSYQVPNLVGLTLATTDAGAIEVSLDGAALGRVGQPQQILGRVSLDPQSLSDRYTNRR